MAALTYEQSMDRNKFQDAMIEALRDKSGDQPAVPKGRKFGKHVVQPHWTEELVAPLTSGMGSMMGGGGGGMGLGNMGGGNVGFSGYGGY